MKKNILKRLFAGLLAATMAIPMFAFASSAEVEPGPTTAEKTVSVDFENNVTINEDNSFAVDGFGGKTQNNPVATITENGTENDYLIISNNKGTGEYRLFSNGLISDKYTVSFDVNFLDLPYHYGGWAFCPTNGSTSNQRFYYQYGEYDGADDQNWENKFRTHIKVADGLSVGTWYAFTATRNGTSFTFSVVDKSTDTEILTKTETISVATSDFMFRVMFGSNTVDTDYRIAFDNIRVTSTVTLENEMVDTYVSEGFDNFAMPEGETSVATGLTKTDNGTAATAGKVGALSAYMTGDFTTTIESENDNQYLKIYSATGANGFWLYPENFAATSYTLTGDVKIDGNQTASAYSGFYFCFSPTSSNQASQFLFWDDASKGMKVGENIFISPSDFNKNTWYSFKIVCSGNGNFTYSLWERDAEEPTVYTTACSKSAAAGLHTPAFRVMGGGATEAMIGFDNIVFTKGSTSVNTIGAQKSEIADNKYAVRFVGTVDSADYTKVAFQVKATYEGGVKYFNLESTTVYTEITANDKGIAKYSAEALGGKYLIAMGIHDIPTSLGNVKFEITAVCYDDTDNVVATAAMVDCYTVIDGNTLKLVDEVA